jgi:hypothetical protein
MYGIGRALCFEKDGWPMGELAAPDVMTRGMPNKQKENKKGA